MADRHAHSCALLSSLTIPSAEVMKHVNKCLYNEHDRLKHCLAAVCLTCACFNEAPELLQMLASVASALVLRFNFRGPARW